jgi:hypothetical protein
VAETITKPVSESPESIEEETIRGKILISNVSENQDFSTPMVMEFFSSIMSTLSKQLSMTLAFCSTDSLLYHMHPNNSSQEESRQICQLPPRR